MNVEVVQEDVAPFDRRLDARDQQDPPLPRVISEILAEGEGVVVRDAEDLEAVARRAVDERAGVVRDEGFRLAGVKVEIGFQQTQTERYERQSPCHTARRDRGESGALEG